MKFDSFKLPAHLPERLTISFPIWGLIDTGADGYYHDLKKFVREHVERGFNCIRLEDGAGLTHDRSGKPRGRVPFGPAFGPYSYDLRQFECSGNRGTGECDMLERLISLAEEAKKQHVFLILSSWFYLHVFWIWKDIPEIREMYAVPPLERFQTFAVFQDYILCELEKRGLDSVIAFMEVFNEADGLPFINDYNRAPIAKEETLKFREAHQAAIAWLKKRHPQIQIGYDTFTPWTDSDLFPGNTDVWNFNNYFAWPIYSEYEQEEISKQCMVPSPVPVEEIYRTREGLPAVSEDWYPRVWTFTNLDPAKVPLAEKWFSEHFEKNYDSYVKRLDESLANAADVAHKFMPGRPVVSGEGVTYSGAKILLWEEKNPAYWELVKYTMTQYRKAGMWGSVVRTCCGPEDPCWTMCAETLKSMNDAFLKGDKVSKIKNKKLEFRERRCILCKKFNKTKDDSG